MTLEDQMPEITGVKEFSYREYHRFYSSAQSKSSVCIGAYFHSAALGKGFYFPSSARLKEFLDMGEKDFGINWDREMVGVKGVLKMIEEEQVPIYIGKDILNQRVIASKGK